MRPVISQIHSKLITNLILLSVISCTNQEFSRKELPINGQLALPSGKVIQTRLALTQEEKVKGLSGVKSDNFGLNQGVLFFYTIEEPRRFWMPDTYFNLNIIFQSFQLEEK